MLPTVLYCYHNWPWFDSLSTVPSSPVARFYSYFQKTRVNLIYLPENYIIITHNKKKIENLIIQLWRHCHVSHALLSNLTWTKARYRVYLCCLSLMVEGRTHNLSSLAITRNLSLWKDIAYTVGKRNMINLVDFSMFILNWFFISFLCVCIFINMLVEPSVVPAANPNLNRSRPTPPTSRPCLYIIYTVASSLFSFLCRLDVLSLP